MADNGTAVFDIIVPAHGHMELTIRCIYYIYRYTATPFHMIVMDDSTPDMDDGTDMTPEWLARFARSHPNFEFFHSEKPYSSSYEYLNEAFRHCQTPYVALVVNSMEVEPEWEIAALQLMKTNPKAGVIGLKQLNRKTGMIESAGMASSFGQAMLSDIGAGLPSHRLPGVYECDAVAWAFVLLRKEAVVGTMDKCHYHGFKGWEEMETCMVMREKGWKILYCGLGVGYHQTRATREAKNMAEARLNLENREVFAKRWGYWDSYYEVVRKEYFPHIQPRDKEMANRVVAGVERDRRKFELAGMV